MPQADEGMCSYSMETALSCSTANLHQPEVPEITSLAISRNFALCHCCEPPSQFTANIITQMCQEGSQRGAEQPKLTTQSI